MNQQLLNDVCDIVIRSGGVDNILPEVKERIKQEVPDVPESTLETLAMYIIDAHRFYEVYRQDVEAEFYELEGPADHTTQ